MKIITSDPVNAILLYINISGGDIITQYIIQWMKLETLEKDAEMKKILGAGLELRHVVSLYELVEDRVADKLIDCVDQTYKCQMPADVKAELMNSCEFEDTSGRLGKIPADAFAKALKRFALRILSVKPIPNGVELHSYLTLMNFWSDVSEDVVEKHFPENLLVDHSHTAYVEIKMKMDRVRAKQKASMARTPNPNLRPGAKSVRNAKQKKNKFNES